ncbi:FAD-binding oxidoreductase [Peribacillus sp. R9-11]|uniref:FAD-binding oxidoreductase n=1 Tax=Peribacillus sp. R9-11 TaxID=3073271 RepID=UPI002868550B|nr:FAD-binding oxidoreductase [Peribacillus sp. R9-11]WMX56252.1 FAD-binding oxidoreductase [Peribacillus sp. R9-11]
MEKTKLTGRVVTPGDSEYEQARINNNLSFPKFPKIIVFCQNTKDVQNALKWARENHIPFRVRSGRHSYENFSLVNGGLIIDVSEMDRIKVNREKMIAKIEAGANLGKVYNKLWEYGTTIPAGTESSVGLVGLTLGGGIGMLTRLFGLTCDNLIEIEMVRASGSKGAELIKANKNHNSDLFWACCGGGGGNFGIVTSFTFKVHPISRVSVFSITWGWEDFEAVFNAWQNWAPHTDDRLTSEIEFKSKEVNQIIAQGEFVGTSSRLKQLLQPLTTTGSPTSVLIKEVPYIEAVRFFDDPSGNQSAHRKRSGSFLNKPFPKKAILTMKQFLEKAPNENSGIWHQSLGGAAGKVEPKKTAFYYRDAIIAQEYLATWNNPEEERENIRWIKELRSALSPYTTGDYVNWPDRQIKDWPTAYYGENFKRLREVKTAYDPFNTFKFPQSIPPYNSGFKKNRGAPFL